MTTSQLLDPLRRLPLASANGSRMPGAHGSSSAIGTWVKAHYKASTIGGQTVYDPSKSV